jgi:GntR family transcriptional regulator of arabinose operon
LLADIQSVLSENGYDTLLFDSQSSFSRERTILQRILASDTIAGVIFEGVRSHIPNPNADLYRKCSNLGIPFVFIHGVNYELGNVISVLDDNYNGAHMLTEYLYRLGHRRIGGIFRIDDMQGAERFKGYSSAMRELGLPLNDTDTYWFYTYTALDTIPNESYFHSYWQDPKNTIKDCTAFICYSDIVAANLVHFLQENGYSVPGDYSVVAFDNDIAGEHCTPRITSLAHTGQSIGTLAADTLIRMIRGESCSSARVPWTLVEKESCAPLEK